MMKTVALLGLVCATANAAAVTNAAVAAADVCKDDEWSYLCNKDAWAGAADAVTGGKELQTAALRRALDHTIAHTACAVGDKTCAEAKDIVDAQLLAIPKVINSNRLAQVHDDAGIIHPASATMSWSAAAQVTAQTRHTTALYSGATLKIDPVINHAQGSEYIDGESLIKWVDAAKKNGCDDSDGSTDAAQRLAGDKDVRGSAHVMFDTSVATCSGGKNTGTDAEKVLFHKCESKNGQGRKACQTAGCKYTPPTLLTVAFSYAHLTATGVATTAKDPKTHKWRLCMTSPSVADNTVFADTALTVSASCPDKQTWVNYNCVCEAGRTTDLNSGSDAGAGTHGTGLTNLNGQCMGCPLGKTSVPQADNKHTCTRCPIGKMGAAGSAQWTTAGKDIDVTKRVAAAAGTCTACPAGKYGKEHNTKALPARYGTAVHAEADVCESCPTGTYSSAAGAIHPSDCKNCGGGLSLRPA